MRMLSSFAILTLISAVIAGIILLVRAVVNSYGFKFKWKWWSIALVLAVLIFIGSGLLRAPIDLAKVEKMELHTYDHVRMGKVELTQAEQWMIAFLYNISLRGGEITAEPCCDSYRVETYLTDGRKISVSENGASIMNVRVRNEKELDNFCASCPLLVDYILTLAEKYDLPID
ncbi:MAG: hypothetical protein IJF02_01345 [Oscillospiraceae bacterium]|nr:hypothetical protein [Oscillospiraceae bacterium]